MDAQAKQRLEEASHAIVTAANVLRLEMPVFEAFLKECADMENFGWAVNPTLYQKPERRAVSALMEPLFRAAVDFVQTYDRRLTEAKKALEKVGAA